MQNIYSRTEYINPNALYTLLSFHDITDHTFQILKVFEDNKPVNKDSFTEATELVAKVHIISSDWTKTMRHMYGRSKDIFVFHSTKELEPEK